MKYTKHYLLMLCQSEHDATICSGDTLFTFDTPQQAQECAQTPWFKKEMHVVSEYQWKEQNNGERFETSFMLHIPFYEAAIPYWLVIYPIQHNPTEDKS